MRILVLNGPNLNLLGSREPHIYGTATFDELSSSLALEAVQLGIHLEVRQTNHEGQLVDWVQQSPGQFDGILLNPGGYTHTSVSLLDALLACPLPVVEVHLSNLARREEFRQHSLTARGCAGRIDGFGTESYRLGLLGLLGLLQSKER